MNRHHKIAAIALFLLFESLVSALAHTPPLLDAKAVCIAQKSPHWVIVDTRDTNAFNGWKLDGVSRGGHIPQAKDFSATWLKVKRPETKALLKEALATKGITKEKNILLYDANGIDALAVAEYLSAQGFSKLYRYDFNNWAQNLKRPLIRYPNHHLIVPPVILKAVIDGKKPESFTHSKRIMVVEASWGAAWRSYNKGHIPGAFHIDTDRIEPPSKGEPAMWMLAEKKILQRFALACGFTKETTVVVTSEEPLAAFRVATVLRYMGMDDVRVLNGGVLAWKLAGFELEKKSHEPSSTPSFGGPIPGNPHVMDTMEEVKKGLLDPRRFTLVDNRTWKEHIGETSGYFYHLKKGRVPGAVFGYAGKKDAYSMDHYRNPDQTMRNAEEILALWKSQGIDTQKHLSFMCGSGWRVAEVFTYADLMGLKDIAIFSDGWVGWSNAGNPIETGIPNLNVHPTQKN
ncbi:MAG: thiosulfate sulfurtransferase [Desulfobacterales bacterium]|nr:thiosulfate sulfurtransferase [Desulfobacterales bacterium]